MSSLVCQVKFKGIIKCNIQHIYSILNQQIVVNTILLILIQKCTGLYKLPVILSQYKPIEPHINFASEWYYKYTATDMLNTILVCDINMHIWFRLSATTDLLCSSS